MSPITGENYWDPPNWDPAGGTTSSPGTAKRSLAARITAAGNVSSQGAGSGLSGIVYQGGNNTVSVNGTTPRQFVPNMRGAQFYFGWNANLAGSLIPTYAAAGLWIRVEIHTDTNTTYTQIANGTNDAKIKSWITYLDSLGVEVHLALKNEPELGKHVPTDNSAANYVKAANHWADLINDTSAGRANKNGNVQSLVWYASSPSAAWLPDVNKFQNVSWDPYKTGDHPVSETATQTFDNVINNVLVPNGWTTDKVNYHISETGVLVYKWDSNQNYLSTPFTAQQRIAWWNSVPAAMQNLNIKSITYFRDDAGKKWQEDGGAESAALHNSVDAASSAMLIALNNT